MKNYRPLVAPQLEEGLRIMIYAGVGARARPPRPPPAAAREGRGRSPEGRRARAADDWICNWMGNRKWLTEMAWSNQTQFVAAPERNWTVDGKLAGSVQAHGPLSFVKVTQPAAVYNITWAGLWQPQAPTPPRACSVHSAASAFLTGQEPADAQAPPAAQVYNAGHMVPMDQGKHALAMLRGFLRDEPLAAAAAPRRPAAAHGLSVA
jgi:hypothetical protein